MDALAAEAEGPDGTAEGGGATMAAASAEGARSGCRVQAAAAAAKRGALVPLGRSHREGHGGGGRGHRRRRHGRWSGRGRLRLRRFGEARSRGGCIRGRDGLVSGVHEDLPFAAGAQAPIPSAGTKAVAAAAAVIAAAAATAAGAAADTSPLAATCNLLRAPFSLLCAPPLGRELI
jgi:hypothetical protein